MSKHKVHVADECPHHHWMGQMDGPFDTWTLQICLIDCKECDLLKWTFCKKKEP